MSLMHHMVIMIVDIDDRRIYVLFLFCTYPYQLFYYFEIPNVLLLVHLLNIVRNKKKYEKYFWCKSKT